MTKENLAHVRRSARALALQALYEVDVALHGAEESLKWLKEEHPLPASALGYALQITKGVVENRSAVDELIRKYAPAWPVNQLSVIDRNILRLALYEIRFNEDTPNKVAINEAVELAKAYGSESSPRFINGVLGSVMDEMEAAAVAVSGSTVMADDNSQEG